MLLWFNIARFRYNFWKLSENDWDAIVNESDFDLNIIIDYWGLVRSDGCGRVLLIGPYILNSRVQLIIDLTILEW